MGSSYLYQYLDSQGKKHSASVDASSLTEAKEKLRARNILILSLQEATGLRKMWLRQRKKAFGPATLFAFTSQLSQLLSAGIPLYESLLALEEQYQNDPAHPVLLNLCEQIKGGASLSTALKQFPTIFSPLYTSMVQAAESVGTLPKALEKLALLLGKQRKIKHHILQALLYPCILLVFSFLVVLLLLLFVIPTLESLFEEKEPSGLTALVIAVSHFLRFQWGWYLPLGGSGLLGAFYLFFHPKFHFRLRCLLFQIPFLRTPWLYTDLTRFCRTLGNLLEGGVRLLPALAHARMMMRSPFLQEAIVQAEARIVAGSLLSQELKHSPWIPSLLIRMVALGEEGGNLAPMLLKVADLYEEEMEKILNRITALAQPVVLIFMGIVIGIIMLSVLLPLTDASTFM